MKNVLEWCRKNFNFIIVCTLYRDRNTIECVANGNLLNKIVFNRKYWVKLPNFIVKRITFKPIKKLTSLLSNKSNKSNVVNKVQ